jgi:hypothetical protein
VEGKEFKRVKPFWVGGWEERAKKAFKEGEVDI